jgi:signal transduction histidine kinase
MARAVNAHGSAITHWQIDAIRYAILSRLADDLAHEIKNPLNSMVINLEVLRNKVEKGATDTAIERTDVLDHEIRRLHELVDGLLRLLRPRRDQTGVTALSLVLDEVLPLVQLRARLAHVDLRLDGPSADAFTSVPADLLRFGLLAATEHIVDLARQSDSTMRLTVEAQPTEIHIRLGWAADPVSARASDWPSDDDPGALRGIPAASILLEPAGCRLELQSGDAAGLGSALLIRVPRLQFL